MGVDAVGGGVEGIRQPARGTFAVFQYDQFGVQTMAEYGQLFRSGEDEGKKDESGPYAVYTLKDEETIAKLATGIKRFKMPDEFNPIKLLMTIAADEKDAESYAAGESPAPDMLATIYEDRQQYDTAADWIKKAIARFGAGPDGWRTKRLEQVVGNWGQFENTLVQPAGETGAKVDFRFRNAEKVSFSAHEVDVPALLEDVKAYIRTKPKEMDWEKLDVGNIGWRVVEKNQKKYIGKEVAAWDLALKPRAGHFDRMISVETPLKKPGAYLLEGKLEKGNISRIIVWVTDTVIVRKPLSDASYTYVADAVTGAPVGGAKVDYFGYRQEWVKDRN